jgi:hypothetical protein
MHPIVRQMKNNKKIKAMCFLVWRYLATKELTPNKARRRTITVGRIERIGKVGIQATINISLLYRPLF